MQLARLSHWTKPSKHSSMSVYREQQNRKKIHREEIVIVIQGKNNIPGVSGFHKIIFITDTWICRINCNEVLNCFHKSTWLMILVRTSAEVLLIPFYCLHSNNSFCHNTWQVIWHLFKLPIIWRKESGPSSYNKMLTLWVVVAGCLVK